ncbi:hypothetical protein M758_3G200600 [Ceratodon purpureus]|nr:hypothetical protein M758_3G200600 [Ceratodon purpureus]
MRGFLGPFDGLRLLAVLRLIELDWFSALGNINVLDGACKGARSVILFVTS